MTRFITQVSLLLILSWCTKPLFAQTTTFPDNSAEFVSQLDGFMNASKRPDMAESYSVFKKLHKSARIAEPEMQQIIRVCNKLRDLKLAAFPYFKDYINAVSLAKSASDTSLFVRWHPVAEKVVLGTEQGKTKNIGPFLRFSADFLESQSLKKGEGGGVTWKLEGGSWQLLYDETSKQVQLQCENTNLTGIRKKDAVTIYQTSGVYLPFEERWKGSSGKVSWEAVGLDSTVYALLNAYEVEVKKTLFNCDTALLYYPLYFPKGPIAGSLSHYVEVSSQDSSSKYPRFESFNKRLEISKLGEGILYTGGFKLWGSSIYGQGSTAEPAEIQVFNKVNKKIFRGAAELFIIKRGITIVGDDVDAKMILEDSSEIVHPGAQLRLDIRKQSIVMERGQKGSQRNPFFSTFYNMNLDAERIAYYYNADSLEIGAQIPGRKGVPQTVNFESTNLYEPATMIRLQNIASKNPISSMYLLALRTGQNEAGKYVLTDDAFAAELNPKWDHANIQTILAQMVAEGFISYYFSKHQIVVSDKLLHYAQASTGKKDFDAIKIESTSTQSNAKLDLKSKQTLINDVKRLELSARQHVAIVPQNRQMTLLKNRDMRLSGRLFAGYALFEGKDMAFNYDKFEVQFDSVRNLDFYLPFGEKDPNTGQRNATAMNSTIEYISGVLLVDAPNNKSGKEDLAMFPSMQSKKPSYVYYQRPETQNNVYRRDSFFFRLDPFAFNSLDDYEPSDLQFKGEMFPALIFPPYRETIVLRPDDKSFGYVHTTPVAGYPTYTGKGLEKGKIDLSNKGLLGQGTLSYLTADIDSEDFIFRPKQTTGTARRFDMEEDRTGAVKTPQAKGQDVKVNWLPFRDSMYVESKEKDFALFKQPGYFHKGILILTPSGLKGKGVFEWTQGKLSSKLIAYAPFQAGADTADLQIKSINGSGIAFDSKNVDGELDFDAQTGRFKANTANANTTLPLDQYMTSMNEFDWDMKKQTIVFKADPNKPAVFISTDPDRDSLRFEGKTAIYDMSTNLLKIGGVEVIKSADAFIYTETGNIEIKSGGSMGTLENAKIIADTVNKYHTITRATVDIKGKKDYKAKGYYQYNIPGYEQEVFFENIYGERVGGGTRNTKNVLTSASGTIKEDASFRMDRKVFFKGEANLEANKPSLRFEGFAKIDSDQLPGSRWFRVNTTIDKNNPILRIKNSKNEADDPLITGLYQSRETGELYPRILQTAYARVDRPILDVQDYFKYEPENDRFIFGDSAKIVGNAIRGSKMIFDNRVGSIQAEGPLGFGSGLQFMKVKAAGRLRTDFVAKDSSGLEINGEVMSGAEITLPAKLTDIMLSSIRSAGYDAPGALYTAQNAFYQQAVPEFIPQPELDASISADLKNNLILLPKGTNKYTFLLGMHKVTWNNEYQSFLSMDDKMPLISVNGELINKVFTTYVEYKMPGSEDDRYYLYLSVTPELWYFFGYQSGVMNVASSDTKFNDLLFSMKPKDLQVKMSDDELYEIVPANPNIATAFVNRVKQGRTKN